MIEKKELFDAVKIIRKSLNNYSDILNLKFQVNNSTIRLEANAGTQWRLTPTPRGRWYIKKSRRLARGNFFRAVSVNYRDSTPTKPSSEAVIHPEFPDVCACYCDAFLPSTH